MKTACSTVLAINQDLLVRLAVRATLSGEDDDAELLEAPTAQQALFLIAAQRPDVILLDLDLPDTNCQRLIRSIRDEFDLPVIACAYRKETQSLIHAIRSGATDYLIKPFLVCELRSRLDSMLPCREASDRMTDEQQIRAGDLCIDLPAGRAFVRDHELDLTDVELRLLCTLVRNLGQLLTYQFLIEEIWGVTKDSEQAIADLKTTVCGLRQKIEPQSGRRRLVTELGLGYRLLAE